MVSGLLSKGSEPFLQLMATCRKRVHGILFDFDDTLVPTLEANLYAFNKVKDKLLEYFAANDAENVASKYQTLVTKTHRWPPDSFQTWFS